MHGQLLAMPPAFNDNASFPRSHSSSNIPDLASFDHKRVTEQHDEELPRSASFSNLPILQIPFRPEKELHRVSVDLTTRPLTPPQTKRGQNSKAGNRLSKEERPKLERLGRRKSLVARPKSWISRVKGGSPERQDGSESGGTTPTDAPPVPQISKAVRDSKTKTVSESFATFARRSWITSSRSPSPNRIKDQQIDDDGQHAGSSSKMTGSPITSSSRSVIPPTKFDNPTLPKISDSPPKGLLRAPTTNQKPKQRPTSVLMNFTTFNSNNSSSSSLPRSSLDNRSTPRTSQERAPVLPKSPSNEKLQSQAPELPRRRDELWSAFRSLENDFSKFQAKSWSLKTNVVRSSLLPFLRNHASHPSNKNLRPEDLDRRITILNKWWTGLLEVLDGRQNQTVSGVDRPILLEACYAIMTRPEWRMAPSHFAPLAERSANYQNQSPVRRPRSQKSSASLNSSASQFLTESVHHNARNLFIQNLLSQMGFVVDKMSLRHAPASLVTFCGKAAAYAFFFVPGVAEVLVRIWKLQADVLRRTADELGMPRRVNKSDLDDVLAPFPVHIHSLGWTSVKCMTNQLRQDAYLPILAAKIPWYGPWVSRWCGRDSDLFYVFVKHYHILAEEFLPSDLSLTEKARSPGFVLVQAQVLTALDSTIHRQPTLDPLPNTFDDILSGADANAAALPLPSNNSARLMAENRLIMLLRDFVSERPSEFHAARMTFAETFSKMMQAVARRTSLFDHNACFVLCDFMEEALMIFVRFHHALALESDFIDWYFWLDVCKKMLESENSMSEIRLFAFLYGSWNVIINNEYRKEVMCLEWLLTEDSFDKFFNHWCPMVRAYYMRLLCWRLCRDDGDASELDTKIYSTVSARVKTNWAYYQYLKQSAERNRVLLPSTAPCHPAPGRRLLIIRNDNQVPTTSLFLGFDGIVAPAQKSAGTAHSTAFKRHSSLKLDTTADINTPKLTPDTPSPSSTPNKKRWTFMGKILPSTFTSESPNTSPPRTTSPTKTLEEARRETALSRSRPSLHAKTSSTDSETPPSTSTHRAFSFKFSLEWSQHFEKPSKLSSSSDSRSERRLCPPRLPAPAQAWLNATVPGVSKEVGARDPKTGYGGMERGKRAKYAGRALAEWVLVVGECNNFLERRKAEGVPGLKWVEVPTLGVEGFRRFG
ncbi:DUF1765 domain containing protein [Hyaloscypha variabilis]